ncbi:hypothetical protein [Nitritalea halalkaliphila]|uniref:hypothetical protein n=1 Tax=Nitritalea halalkaliphila TaxID=590849 RepID=UPI0005933244|nr:hypothetical protein [Nitritalea halalkaliphila]
MLHQLVQLKLNTYDYLHDRWEGPRVIKFISNTVIFAFFAGLLIVLLENMGLVIPYLPAHNAFFAIELAFNVLLIFEALGLIFLIPHSVADAVGKQFEIISLLLLRDAFKEFGHYVGELSWDTKFLIDMLPVVSDAFGAILLFLITGLFYKAQKHIRITRNQEEQEGFIRVKKLLSIYLALSFIGLGIYDIVTAYQTHKFIYSMKLFYNLLIFSDIFILLFSLRYTTKYYNLFRYSSFALATIFLRLTLSAPAYFNVLMAILAGLMVLLVTYIYNKLIAKVTEDIDVHHAD